MNLNDPIGSDLNNNNENETQERQMELVDRYDKQNFKYNAIAFSFILFTLINLSFYFKNSFSFVEENYLHNYINNDRENEGIFI